MNNWSKNITDLELGEINLDVKSAYYALTRIMASIRLAGWTKKTGQINMKFLNPYIGNVCRLAREREDITPREITLRTGYSRQTISNFENGKSGTFDLLVFYIQYLTISDVKKISNSIIWGGDGVNG